MSIAISPTSTNWQDKYFDGVSPTNYIKPSSRSQHKSIKFPKPDNTVSRRSKLENKLSNFWQIPTTITQNKEKSKESKSLTTLIKLEGLSNQEIALYKWESYIANLYTEAYAEDAGFTTKVLDHARQILKNLNSYFTQDQSFLEVPDASPGESDNFMFLWDKGEHYLECDIFGNGTVEFFYRNRSTNEIWGEDITVETKITPAIRNKLMLFVIPKR